MRTPVQWDDTHVVNHLHANRDVPWPLHNLIVVVVSAGEHRDCGVGKLDAAVHQRPVLRAIGWKEVENALYAIGVLAALLDGLIASRNPLLRFGRVSRDSSIRWIHHE